MGIKSSKKVSSLNAPIYFFAICSNKSLTTKPEIDSAYINSQDDLFKLMEVGWRQTQTELERSQAQLQETQTELERSQAQLQETQQNWNTRNLNCKRLRKN